MTETRTHSPEECPRCGSNHADVTMRRLDNPPEYARWWWTCPLTNQPVFTELAEDLEQQNFDEAIAESLVESLEVGKKALDWIALTWEEDKGSPDVGPKILADIDAKLRSTRTEAERLLAALREANREEGTDG